jgi:hypothetical protein
MRKGPPRKRALSMTERPSRTTNSIAGPAPILACEAPTDEISPADLELREALAGSGLTVADIDALAADLDHAERQALRRVDKKRKSPRRKSAYDDARSGLMPQGLRPGTAGTDPAEPLVTSATAPTAPLHHSKKAEKAWAAFAKSLDGLPQRRLPAAWRDLSDMARETYWNRAAVVDGGRAFSFNFSPEEEGRLRDCPSAIDRIRERFDYHLRADVGHVPAYWFRLESTTARGRRLHGHGAMVIPADARTQALIRRALRRACGEWAEGRQHQVRFGPTPDDGWATYSGKDAVFNRQGGIVDRAGERHYRGKPSYATRQLKASAKTIYARDRDLIIAGLETHHEKTRSPFRHFAKVRPGIAPEH